MKATPARGCRISRCALGTPSARGNARMRLAREAPGGTARFDLLLATSGSEPISPKTPLAHSNQGAGTGPRCGSAYPRQMHSRVVGPIATTTSRPTAWRDPQVGGAGRASSSRMTPALVVARARRHGVTTLRMAPFPGGITGRVLIHRLADRVERAALVVLRLLRVPLRDRGAAPARPYC